MRGDGEQVLVEFVIVGQRLRALRQLGEEASHPALHGLDESGRLGGAAASGAKLSDLGIGTFEVARRRLEQRRDAEGFELTDEALDVIARHDEVGAVPGDGLDIGGEAGEAGLRDPGGVVGLVVDRHHLPPGPDGEQILGETCRQGDDPRGPGRQRHLAVAGLDGRGEGCRRHRA